MMTTIQDLQTQQTGRSLSFPRMLEQFKGEIARALPRHLNGDRMARIALTAFRLNPKLGQCDPASVFAAVIQASQLGLEPNMRGRASIVPFGRECQLIPGWQGLVELMNRTGRASVWTQAVFAGDDFDYAYGDSPFIHHKPGIETNPEMITHAYAVGKLKGNESKIIEVWSSEKIRVHRDRYNKVGNRHYSYSNWEMYCRKVVLLQVLKYLPSSAELDTAVALDDAAEIGKQSLKVKDAIEGTWMPAEDEQDVDDYDEGESESEPNDHAETWPKRIVDPETGEVTWKDSIDDIFNREKHALGPNGEPSMRRDGTFRARPVRKAKKAQARRDQPAKPEPAKQQEAPKQEPAQQELPPEDDGGFGVWE